MDIGLMGLVLQYFPVRFPIKPLVFDFSKALGSDFLDKKLKRKNFAGLTLRKS